MNKEDREGALESAFAEFAYEYPQSALVLITGLFVSLLEHNVEEQGGNSTREIKIDGCGKRDIIVCAVPSLEETSASIPTAEPVAWRVLNHATGGWSYRSHDVPGLVTEALYTHPQKPQRE